MRDDGAVGLKLITGPANSGKARAVLADLRAHAARGREPLMVVPTRGDAEHYRRELAEGGTVFGVRVERFGGLAEELARRAGAGRRPLSAILCERVAAAAVTGARLRTLGDAATTPGFPRALAAFAAELAAQRVEPGRLRSALSAWAAADRSRRAYGEDLVELYGRYRALLERLGRGDPEVAAWAALDELRRSPARWGTTPVCFYGFDDLTAAQIDAIETLAGAVDAPVTVTLAYEPGRHAFAGRATTFQQLRPLADEHVALAADDAHYASGSRVALHHLERGLFEAAGERVDPGKAVALLEAGGERAEYELVAGEVSALLQQGLPAGEIALVARLGSDSGELLAEVLRAYEIPHALARRTRLTDTAAGAGLLGLLRCALLGGSLHDLLAYLRTPGVLSDPRRADELEARARAAGASSAAAALKHTGGGRWPLAAMDRLSDAADRGPGSLLAGTVAELDRLVTTTGRRRAPRPDADGVLELRALALVRRTVGELRELGRGRADLVPDAAGVVAMLAGLTLADGEQSPPDTVVVCDPLALRARRVRVLFVCGLQEGLFPAVARGEPFLSDRERRRLAMSGGLSLPRHDDGLGAERYLLYALISRPQERLVLSWRTADDAGTPLAPSLFVDDVCDLFSGLRDRARRRPLGAVGWSGPGPRPAGMVQRARPPGRRRAGDAGLAPLSDPSLLSELAEARWSASGLEAWAQCPVRWFVERRLRAGELEPDAEALVRGGVAHRVLEATLGALATQTGSARLTPLSLPLARRLLATALHEHGTPSALSTLPERQAAAQRRLSVDLERYLEHAAASPSPFEPAHLELSFGFDDDALPALDLGDGIRVRGRVDRVDRDQDGHALVWDYKGKRAPEAAGWLTGHSFQMAVYMRVVEQLLDARVVGGLYQPLGRADLRARGLVDSDAAPELDCVVTDRRPGGEFSALVEQVLDAARTAAHEARGGGLRARPQTCSPEGCMYPSICRCER